MYPSIAITFLRKGLQRDRAILMSLSLRRHNRNFSKTAFFPVVVTKRNKLFLSL